MSRAESVSFYRFRSALSSLLTLNHRLPVWRTRDREMYSLYPWTTRTEVTQRGESGRLTTKMREWKISMGHYAPP